MDIVAGLILLIWIIGLVGVWGERSKAMSEEIEQHDRMRITGLTFIGFALISSFPVIALVVLALQLQ